MPASGPCAFLRHEEHFAYPFVALSRVHDALLTRLSNDDDMEKSLSTFANEMASSAMILGKESSSLMVSISDSFS